MAGSFALRAFLRQASNALLKTYASNFTGFASVRWDGLGQTEIEPIMTAWDALEGEERTRADAELRDVFELGDESGVKAIRDEAAFHGINLTEKLALLDDDLDRSLWTFLEHRTVFDNALRFSLTDRLPARQWQKRKNAPTRRPDDSEEARERLAQALSHYFRTREGRGQHCRVEVYKRQNRYYFFAYLADHARAEQDFVGGQLRRQPHSPAFEVVFASEPETGTLETFASGGRKVVHDLEQQFALSVFGEELRNQDQDDRVYELEGLRERAFSFVYPSSAGIKVVYTRKLRLSYRYEPGKRLVLEGTERGQVHALYEDVTRGSGDATALPPSAVRVTQAEIRVVYEPAGNRRPSAKLIRLTYPNGCSLGHNDRDDVLRKMLVDSGIDPTGLSYGRLR